MPEYYTAENVVSEKFVFISYSHQNKQLVEDSASYLIDEGVRLWYDRSFTVGDEWSTDVENLLKHENCRAVILFCSPDAILSENVAKERGIALSEQTKRGKKNYPLFLVNICESGKPISYMQMLKQAFDRIQYETADRDFPLRNIKDYVNIVGNDPICIMTSDADFGELILGGIKKRVPDVINKNAINIEKMEAASNKDKIIFLKFGKYKDNGASVPVKWRFLYNDNENAVFLSETVLGQYYGGELLEQWINGDFKKQIFTSEEAEFIQSNLRLLSKEESESVPKSVLATGSEWWLSDKHGNLQAIIRDDGSLYRNGYNNKRFQKGIRPVLILTTEQAKDIISNQNS